ncbi:hypothetical protein [Nocardioides litoris]|uniref:hypothetical protein n=1 Tax=Nocardioides litoris TaxID=1926648 RepID=UPI0011217392|nr:hypothetical protein [Nocardioides litoris]
MEDSAPARPRLLVGLLVGLLVLLVAVAGILLHDRRSVPGVEARRPADVGARGWGDDAPGRAVLAARTAAETYFSVDHRTVRADMDRMRALGTPAFDDAYDTGARRLAARVTDQQLTLVGQVPADGAATEYLTSTRARVLVTVAVTTSRAGASRTGDFRTRIGLDLVDGDWLVSSFDEVA